MAPLVALGCGGDTAKEEQPSETWLRAFGSPAEESGWRAAPLPDGGVVLSASGMFGEVSLDFGTGPLSSEGFFVRLDPWGETLWVQTMDAGERIDGVFPISDGGLVVTGGQSEVRLTLARYEADGSRSWIRRSSVLPGYDGLRDVVETADGSLFAVGVASQSFQYEGGPLISLPDIYEFGFLLKLGPDGSHEKTTVFEYTRVGSVSLRSDGTLLLAGSKHFVDETLWLGRVSHSGELLDEVLVPVGISDTSTVTDDTRLVTTGLRWVGKQSSLVVARYSLSDLSGPEWSYETQPPTGYYGTAGICMTPDGGAIVGELMRHPTDPPHKPHFQLLELDGSGTPLSTLETGTHDVSFPTSLVLDSHGRMVITGRFESRLELPAGSAVSRGGADVFVARLGR